MLEEQGRDKKYQLENSYRNELRHQMQSDSIHKKMQRYSEVENDRRSIQFAEQVANQKTLEKQDQETRMKK